MATQYSNKPIVTNGLVYALDFGNQKSYVSGSNSARSLLFNPLTASVITYSTASIPNLTNEGLQFVNNATVNTGNPFAIVSDTGAFTMMYTTKVLSGGIFASKDWNGGALDLNLNPNGSLVGWNYYNSNINNERSYTGNFSSSLTHHTWTYSSGSFTYYVNGIPVTASGFASGYGYGVNITSNITLNGRVYAAFDRFWSGSLFNYYLYNRVLTPEEVYSNYLITAQRVGLSTRPKPYTVDPDVYNFLTATSIVDPIITSSINTFVLGLKSASLWDKMIAIYPFVGTGSAGVNLTGSHRWNLKEATVLTSSFNGSWNGSISGSTPSGSNTFISVPYSPIQSVLPAGTMTYPNYTTSSAHISILSYDTPVSSSILAGTGMTKELAISTLAGDYGTPAAAYSVRKVRTAYSGALMDVRRSIDNVTSSIGYVSNGDLDTGSLLDFVLPGRSTLPGAYSGLAAAYSLRKVSGSYTGSAIQANNGLVYRDIEFDASGNLNTGSLTSLVATGSNVLPGSYSGLTAAYSLRRVSSSYSGFAIEVQSGSVSQSIGFDSFGNLDTGSLLTFAGSGNAFIKTWYDQSGNNNHATQSVAANQPQIINTGSIITQNGKPSVLYSSGKGLIIPPITINQPLTMFWVLRNNNTTLNARHLNGNSNAEVRMYGTNVGLYFGTGFETSMAVQGTRYTYSFKVSGSNSQIFQNSTLKATGNAGSNNITSIPLGINGHTQFLYQSGDFNIDEILFYNSDQSSNRTYIENNINAYYDIYTTSSVSTENAFVSTWYDQSGNARHATQTTASSQPLIVSSGSLVTENGKPAIRFTTDHVLPTPLAGNTTLPFNVFAAVRVETVGPIGTWYLGFTGTDLAKYMVKQRSVANGGIQASLLTGSNISVGGVQSFTTNTSSMYLHSSLYNTPTMSMFIDNTLIGTSSLTDGNYFATQNITIGSGRAAFRGTFKYSELLIYTSDQSTNRTFIENNINTYYNVYTSSNAGFVARWYDQSGNNRHATQTATGSQPIVVLSGSVITQNNRYALNFNGTTHTLSSSFGTTIAQPVSIFSIYKPDITGSIHPIYDGTGARITHWVGGNKYNTFAGVDLLGVQTTTLNQVLHTGIYNGGSSLSNINSVLDKSGNAGTNGTSGIRIGGWFDLSYFFTGKIQELVMYPSNQASVAAPVEYGINNYYNIYTQPTSSNWATSSFTIYATTSSISASINNDLQSGIASTGPLGFITVSRTGSNSLTLARNGVTSSFSVPASGALSTNLYLGAINNNGIALGSSPYNISFASVGVGLTNNDLNNYYSLVDKLQFNLGRQRLLDMFPGAVAAYSVRKLRSAYTGSAIEVQSGTVSQSIGFDSTGNLDTAALLAFAGSGNAFVKTWFDQAGNNNFTQTNSSIQPQIVSSGVILTQTGVGAATPAIRFNGSSQYLNCTETTVSTGDSSLFLAMQKGLGETNILATANGASYYYLSYNGSQYYGTVATSDPNTDFNVTSYGLISVTFNFGNELKFYRNNSLKITRTSPSIGVQTFNRLCGHAFGNYGAVNLNEIVIYPTNQISNRIGINSNINNYYQIY
jgi:hypothetical protein